MNKHNIKIPDGYRPLRVGSKILRGDKFTFIKRHRDDDDWSECFTTIGYIYDEKNGGGLVPSLYLVITARPERKRTPKPEKMLIDDSFIKEAIGVRYAGELAHKSIHLYSGFNWEIVKDKSGVQCLVATEK